MGAQCERCKRFYESSWDHCPECGHVQTAEKIRRAVEETANSKSLFTQQQLDAAILEAERKAFEAGRIVVMCKIFEDNDCHLVPRLRYKYLEYDDYKKSREGGS